jgi:acyl-CoA synthetase (AMP-forming)/AMP-acid ligase II
MSKLFQAIKTIEEPNKVAFYLKNKTITYSEFYFNIEECASWLIDHNFHKEKCITIASANSLEAIYLLYACSKLNLSLNILHGKTPQKLIEESMRQTSSHVAFVSFPYISMETNHQFVVLQEDIFKHTEKKNTNSFEITSCEDNYLYLHGSGTTGKEQTVVLKESAINKLAEKIPAVVGNNFSNEIMLSVLPIFHGFGLAVGLHAMLCFHGSNYFMPRFSPDEVTQAIQNHQLTILIGVPLLYQKLLQSPNFQNCDLQNLVGAFVGGEKTPKELFQAFHQVMKQKNSLCPLLEGYGLTETVTVVSVNTLTNHKEGSCGQALQGNIIEIRNDEKVALPANSIGEIYLSTNTMMDGYLNDEETTESILSTKGNQVFIQTGDLGYLDEDGYLYITGKKKRTYKVAGIQIFPDDIEKRIENYPGIHHAILEQDDTTKNLSLRLVVDISSFSQNDFSNWLKENFPQFALPKQIILESEQKPNGNK